MQALTAADYDRLDRIKAELPPTWLVEFGSNPFIYRMKCPCNPKVQAAFWSKTKAKEHVPLCKGVGDANLKEGEAQRFAKGRPR